MYLLLTSGPHTGPLDHNLFTDNGTCTEQGKQVTIMGRSVERGWLGLNMPCQSVQT